MAGALMLSLKPRVMVAMLAIMMMMITAMLVLRWLVLALLFTAMTRTTTMMIAIVQWTRATVMAMIEVVARDEELASVSKMMMSCPLHLLQLSVLREAVLLRDQMQ
jgi:hypothetical protein